MYERQTVRRGGGPPYLPVHPVQCSVRTWPHVCMASSSLFHSVIPVHPFVP